MNIIFSDIISLSMFTCMAFSFRLAHCSWLFMPNFFFKIKKTCTTFTKDLNVYAFTRNSRSVLEIAGQVKNYGTVYIISTISMHASV